MRPYFMNTVGDWVEMQYNAQKYLEKAGKVFGEDYMRLSSRMTAGYQDCFTDYLLFEHKPVFFYFKTGLEYFVEFNPQNLDKEIIAEYKEILQTQKACVFEVKRTANGEGVELFSPELGDIFVYDSENFNDWEPGNLVWARVGQVRGKYYFVNDFVPTLSLVPGASKLHAMRPISAQQITIILFTDKEFLHKKEIERDKIIELLVAEGSKEFEKFQEQIVDTIQEIKQDFSKDLPDPEELFQMAKKHFEAVRKELDIKHLFTLNTFNKWIDKEGDDNLDFAFKSLIFFVPEDFLQRSEDHERYIEAGQAYINAYLGKRRVNRMLDGLDKIKSVTDLKKFQSDRKIDTDKLKTDFMREVSLQIDGKNIHGQFMMKSYSWNEYQDLQFAGHRLLRDEKYKESKESYQRLTEKLLREETLFWPSFRVFANAASTYFMMGEFFMALGLIEAALRLNPKYEFGKMMKKNFLESVGAKKPNMELVDNFYKKSVFAEYEKFLFDHEVNLSKKVTAQVRKYSVEDGKIKVADNLEQM